MPEFPKCRIVFVLVEMNETKGWLTVNLTPLTEPFSLRFSLY